MSVQQLAPLTISEIARELAFYEVQYGTTTAAFLAAEGHIPEIDEDDAVEWFYRVEQLRVLRLVDSKCPYSRIERGTPLENCDNMMDCLAA
ncbi:MAG: hypothetical protein ABSA48_07095 [Terracidiphilus sp.]|jgi:hypothetical protein